MNLDGQDEVNPHATKEEYEQSLSFSQLFNEENVNNVDTPSPQYRLFLMQFKMSYTINMTLEPYQKIIRLLILVN